MTRRRLRLFATPADASALREGQAVRLLSCLQGLKKAPRFLGGVLLALALGFILLSLTCTPSGAATDLGENCRHGDPGLRIASCTEIIRSRGRAGKHDVVNALINRGAAYQARGDLDRALADLGEALRAIADYTAMLAIRPHSAAFLYQRAEAYRAENNFDKAIADYDQTLQRDRNLPDAHAGRALAYEKKGDLGHALSDAEGNVNKAIEDFSAAARLDPNFAEAVPNRANAYRAINDVKHARQDYEAALQLDPQLDSARKALTELDRRSATKPAPATLRKTVPHPSPLASTVLFKIGPVPITRPVVTTWGIMLVLSLGSWLLTSRLRVNPDRGQATLELVLTGIMQQIEDVMRVDPRPFIPLIGTLFIFLVAANLAPMLPGVEAPTSKLETPAALALVVFVSVHLFGVRARGLRGYLASFAEPKLIMLPLNIVSEVTRTFSLMVRLFGNVMSGEFMIGLVVALAGLFVPIPLMMLEALLGVIQAYIFTVLATVFIGAAIGAVEK